MFCVDRFAAGGFYGWGVGSRQHSGAGGRRVSAGPGGAGEGLCVGAEVQRRRGGEAQSSLCPCQRAAGASRLQAQAAVAAAVAMAGGRVAASMQCVAVVS